jgi:2-keto-4-pentenoate hydratase
MKETTHMDHRAIAERLSVARAEAQLTTPPSTDPHYTLTDAYAVAQLHFEAIRASGATPVGRKIGFTNPVAWPSMGLNTPVWGYVYDTTVFDAASGTVTHDLRGAVQPKIEPEIMFGLKAGVLGVVDPVKALEAVEWIALGFEVVSCPYPDWQFKGVDAITAFGLHRALFVGAKRYLHATDSLPELVAALGSVSAKIYKNDVVAGEGSGAIVLGNPARALAALAVVVANQPQFAPLGAGEIISSGTLTPPPTILAGDVVRAEVAGLDLAPITVRFA